MQPLDSDKDCPGLPYGAPGFPHERENCGQEERRKKAEDQRKEKVKRQNLLLREKLLMLEKMKVNLAKLEQTLDEYMGVIDPAEARQRKQLKANACEFISRYKIKVSDILTKNGGL